MGTSILVITNYKIKRARQFTKSSTAALIKTYFCPILRNFMVTAELPSEVFISEYNEEKDSDFLLNRCDFDFPPTHKMLFSSVIPKWLAPFEDLYDFIICDNQTVSYVESRIEGLDVFPKSTIAGGQLTVWKLSTKGQKGWPALNIRIPFQTDFPKLDLKIGDGLISDFPATAKKYLNDFLIEDLTRLVVQYCQDNCPIQRMFFN